ncbi:MAG: hypothetical protein ACT6QZ_12140, partial [Methylophilus sp.]|uniref:hypothetical protein n=1 Tax=Methylophilus sp. TaxID=29541 RepID=UPI0040352BD4
HTTTDSTPSRYSTKSTMSGTKSTNHSNSQKIKPFTYKYEKSGKTPIDMRNISFYRAYIYSSLAKQKTSCF